MATRKAAAKAPAGNDAPAPTTALTHAKLVSHTARMNLAIEQSPSGQTHKQRGYDKIIAGYQNQWAGLTPEQRKAAIAEASGTKDLDAKTIKAAVAALEG